MVCFWTRSRDFVQELWHCQMSYKLIIFFSSKLRCGKIFLIHIYYLVLIVPFSLCDFKISPFSFNCLFFLWSHVGCKMQFLPGEEYDNRQLWQQKSSFYFWQEGGALMFFEPPLFEVLTSVTFPWIEIWARQWSMFDLVMDYGPIRCKFFFEYRIDLVLLILSWLLDSCDRWL